MIYGSVAGGGSGATVGVQNDDGSHQYTQYSCNTPVLTPGLQLTFQQPQCTSTTLLGHVTWQGRPMQPNQLQSLPITLTLRSAGGAAYEYPNRMTDANGYFTVTVDTVPNGDYTWRAKGPN